MLLIFFSDNNPDAEFLCTPGTAHGVASCSARQTQPGSAVRAGAVALGADVLCADSDLLPPRPQTAQNADLRGFCLQLRFEAPVLHVLASARRQIARKAAEHHPYRRKRTQTAENRAPRKKIDGKQHKIGIKQRMVQRIHAVSSVHESHQLFGKFHINAVAPSLENGTAADRSAAPILTLYRRNMKLL